MSVLGMDVSESIENVQVVVEWPALRYNEPPLSSIRSQNLTILNQHHLRTNLDCNHAGYFSKVRMCHFHLPSQVKYEWQRKIN